MQDGGRGRKEGGGVGGRALGQIKRRSRRGGPIREVNSSRDVEAGKRTKRREKLIRFETQIGEREMQAKGL